MGYVVMSPYKFAKAIYRAQHVGEAWDITFAEALFMARFDEALLWRGMATS
jgi:hypothetical protein